jgi:transposase-like protein
MFFLILGGVFLFAKTKYNMQKRRIAMPDFKKIKAEYIRGGVSYRKLAEKHGVSFSSIRRRAEKEKWTDLRTQAEQKSSTKIVESVASQEAKRVDGIQTVADMLLEKIKEGVADGTLIVDSQSIRQIVASIKDLRDIKGYKSELDMQEQMARIEKLRKDVEGDGADKEIKVTIGGDLDVYSQ